MSTKKDYTYKYKPIRILSRNAYEIVFYYHLMGDPVPGPGKEDLEGTMKASLPTSLDSMKLWQLCNEKHSDYPQLLPHKTTPRSDTLFSTAVINVTFDNIDAEALVRMGNALIERLNSGRQDVQELPDNKMSVGGANTFPCSKDELDQFVEVFRINQELHERLTNDSENLSEAERTRLEKERKDTYKSCQLQFKKLINSVPEGLNSNLRRFIYNIGFKCANTGNDEKPNQWYRVYKRSANKAKKGSCFFIDNKLRDEMIRWTWLDLEINQTQIDLTSARAYEALVTSSIINKVDIKPKTILLINNKESENVGGNLKILCNDGTGKDADLVLRTPEEYQTKYGESFENKNKIWDGQALVDESIFKKAGYYMHDDGYDNRHGMMLLRNSFFKACAFNTRIRDFYIENGYTEKDTVKDMFGNEIRALDVKMIVTPDSIKLFKFADTFFGGDKEAAYKYWKDNISPVFGIVKEDKASHLGHGNYHEVSYQFLNTLPIHKQKDIDSLLSKDMEYLELLKNNGAVLMHRMWYIDASMRKKFFIYTMFKYFKEFKDTEYFKKYYLKDELEKYTDKLREGRLKLQGDIYYLCSMPYEMLEYTITNKINPQLKPNEVYISNIEDGKCVTLIRYPHLNSGSVCSLVNRENDNYTKWFNFDNKDSTNIVVVSPWNSNIMVKLGGADFDSDTALYIKNEVIEKAAKELMNIKALSPGKDGLPVGVAASDLKKTGIQERKYTPGDMAYIDNMLMESGRTIGEISNSIQLFNSYLWEEYYKGKSADPNRLKAIYDCILKLSVLNELTIDSAKRMLTINPGTETENIKETVYNGLEILTKNKNRLYCPYFLYEVIRRKHKKKSVKYTRRSPGEAYENAKEGEKKKQVNESFWNCPMDLICKTLVKKNNIGKWTGTSLEDLLASIINDEVPLKKSDSYKKVDARKFLIETSREMLSRDGRPEQDDEPDTETEKESNLEKYYSLKLSNSVRLRLFKATFEKYSTNKDGHTKKDYKDKELSDPKIRSRIWGYLFAPESTADQNALPEPPSFIKPSGYCRKDLITEGEYDDLRDSEKANWEQIDLWGEAWYYDKNLE